MKFIGVVRNAPVFFQWKTKYRWKSNQTNFSVL